MKILYIANRPDVFSGGERSLLELISRIDRARFEPVLLCPGDGGFADKAHSMGIITEICDLPSMRTIDLLRIFKTAGEVREIIRRYAVDVVHTNGMRAQFYASLAVKGTKSVLLWHVRESARDWPLYENFLARSADSIVCVSEGVKRAHFRRDDKLLKKARVIYNGVDTRVFSPDLEARKRIRAELGIKDTGQLIGMTGLFVPLKGQNVLLKAFKRLSGAYPDARLLMAGSVIDRSYFEGLQAAAGDMGIEGKVIFSGQRSDMKDVLSAMDIFVLPSSREGFSRALLEAMACALPVVASDVSGNNEAVTEGETGLLVPFGDEARLAEALAKLLADPQKRKEMGGRSRERVEGAFSIESYISAFESLYPEIRTIKTV